jgi:hypothetical protein
MTRRACSRRRTIFECETCGGWFDMRDLGVVLDHEEPLPHRRAIERSRDAWQEALIGENITSSAQEGNLQSGNAWPKSLFSWHCLLISMMAALLLVNPLTARVLPPRYSVRKGFGRYLATLVL